ncbi:uncharacterized protein LOC119686287 [Teleopsis dalmanni]|uniref:uncharacterized protein LOC119686287 n=1 Tax=Teleopsis dalmanni TaxID=139649 RepID=UPI0018CE9960|nr:uncharacterized protein LOC119686287 [Teleopsis dalmanni]
MFLIGRNVKTLIQSLQPTVKIAYYNTKCPRQKAKEEKEEAIKSNTSPFITIISPMGCCASFYEHWPRLDIVHHKAIYHTPRRPIQQTWAVCGRKPKPHKNICAHDEIYYPPKYKRECRERRVDLACEQNRANFMSCKRGNKINHKCLKISSPGCCSSRKPPKCTRGLPPSNCGKVQCPFPSFSECSLKTKPNRKKYAECGCVYINPSCQINKYKK